jgi:regulator of sirC expression with transglutaminase-like and TPR domain
MSDKFNPQRVSKREFSLFAFIVIILSTIAFTPVFNAGFVNWDDDQYVIKNENIKSLDNVGKYMLEPVAGYFHPFTLLTMSIDYRISNGNPHWFHIVNFFIHLINIFLVFFFIYKLTEQRKWLAMVTALLFAIHPLHVESVAWISERKDLLYTLFFMGGLILYLNYLKKNSYATLAGVFILFLFSLLSKPAAVIFPVVLVAIDFYFNRLRNRKTYFEKIPFFALSLILGYITVQVQKTAGAISGEVLFPLASRFFIGTYGIMMYLVKMVFPFNLCTFYPYPAVNLNLPFTYYLSGLFTLGMFVLFVFSVKRNKEIAFAILFYIINLILVLQFFPVGSAVIADRYSYIPLIGPFFIIGLLIQHLIDKNKGKISPLVGTIMAVVILSLVVVSRNQAATWKDGAALWDQAIKACPSSKAYSNRGSLYKDEGKTEEAVELYSKAISLDKFETDALINRANILFGQKQYIQAINDYTQCILVEPRNDKAYANRGAAYLSMGKNDKALADLNLSVEINPMSQNGYKNRGMLFIMTGQYQNAISDFTKHLEIVIDSNGETWGKIGYCFQQLGNHSKAINALSHAIQQSPKGNYYYLRAISMNASGEIKRARDDAKRAMAMGVQVDQKLLKSLGL